MKKWLKSLSRQEKVMALLIVILVIGIILRWDNVKSKAGIWFRADELLEKRSDTLPVQDSIPCEVLPPADSLRSLRDTLEYND